jgi:hypothetical protein
MLKPLRVIRIGRTPHGPEITLVFGVPPRQREGDALSHSIWSDPRKVEFRSPKLEPSAFKDGYGMLLHTGKE